ncbi:ComEC/Rec2 family competence protein [Sphingomonas jaspsi]|uniref:ComEC/Rec2 family competence protein n=1 Tax=Sphingomonas jaspsi TaxID=392409 RepID=UPI000A021BDC|nr:ComEC/Rec2 family competence protein [Sphingomonas jaspsi]
MEWTSAPNTVVAPLPPAHGTFLPAKIARIGARIELLLEGERTQLPLWFVAAFGFGIACWFALGSPQQWRAAGVVMAAVAVAGFTLPGRRLGRCMSMGGAAALAGLALVWWRADAVAAVRLDHPQVLTVSGRVVEVEPRPAEKDIRLTLQLAAPGLPERIRITVADDKSAPGLGEGALVTVRARLQPPPPMMLPGTHDFARDLWFRRIGAVGRALDPPVILSPAQTDDVDALRHRLAAHIQSRLDGGAGGIATALATGDQGGIGEDDADAMRRSGLAHLLSVSGLHIAAVVGAAMFLSLHLLALSQRLALRVNLVLVSAGFGAAAGIAYTVMTGMQVPTVRSCIAALLVLAGMAMGREAISLRLVAVGALVVMAVRPESLVGASFQLSFAAVTAIIAFHALPWTRRHLGPREESVAFRLARSVAGLIATGLVVEIALLPLAMFHFHKAGLYGVAANLVVIPLTTFVVMPLEAAALLFDAVGLGGPLWAACGWSLHLVLYIAHVVGSAPGAVTMVPTVPTWAFGLMVGGGLWLLLWQGAVRCWGLLALAAGAIAAGLSPVPDMLVTGDGRHLALVRDDGVPVLLRDRSGDFVRDMMSEAVAFDGDPLALDQQSMARCSRDACISDLVKAGKAWRILAIRSKDRIDWATLTAACADADLVIAERRLPQGCRPRWTKLDRAALERTGGVSIYLGSEPGIVTVADALADHPWRFSQ